LNGAKIIGIRGDWTSTSHPMLKSLQFMTSYHNQKPTLKKISKQDYRKVWDEDRKKLIRDTERVI